MALKQRVVRLASSLLYERRLGIQTSDRVMEDDYRSWLLRKGLSPADRIGHEASEWLTLPRILDPGDIGPEEVFLDLGCGEGRMLIEACLRYPFKRAVGVELLPELAEVARRNIQRTRRRLRCADIEVVVSDVLEFAVPDDVTVAYVYNAFTGDVFRHMVEALLASLRRAPRRLRLIYRYPLEEKILLDTGQAERVRIGRSVFGKRQRHPHISMYELRPPTAQAEERSPARTT